MTPPDYPEQPREDFPEKVLALHRIFEEEGIPYAIGGAIALAYCSRARATIDIDINIFLPPEEKTRVAEVLSKIFPIPNQEKFFQEVEKDHQGFVAWDKTKIDIFFSDMEFHDSMARRARTVSFGGGEIKVLSPEDLIICKAFYDRSRDWPDIESVCKHMGLELDMEYINSWLRGPLGEDDYRVMRLAKLLEAYS